MTILGPYPEPHSRLPGSPYVPLEEFPPDDLNNIVNNQRAMWDGVNAMTGTVQDMQAVAAATNLSTIFHVNQFGWYLYCAVLPSSVSAPFGNIVYAATGVGSGYWVNESFLALLDGNPEKIRSSLLPYYQLIHLVPIPTPDYVNQLVHNTSYVQVSDHSNNALSLTINGMLTGDILELGVGPLEIFAAAGDIVSLRVRVHQGTVDTNYVRSASGGSAGQLTPSPFELQYTSLSASDVTVFVESKNDGTHNSAINSPNQPSTEWGPASAGFQWLRLRHNRTFT